MKVKLLLAILSILSFLTSIVIAILGLTVKAFYPLGLIALVFCAIGWILKLGYNIANKKR